MRGFSFWCLLVCSQVISRASVAEDWPSWRGPHQDGTAATGSYPTTWSKSEHVAWKVPLPGRGASTPVITGDHVFLTYVQDDQNVGLCLNRNGEKQWEAILGSARDAKHKKASGANSSPITDGQRVIFYFKSGDLACFSLAGKQLWSLNLQKTFGEDTLWWDLGSSPVMSRVHVIVSCLQSGDSYLVAFSKQDGSVVWKQPREMNAPNEANQSYTTPLVLDQDGQEVVIVVGADWVTAHAAEDGSEIWRVGELNPDREEFFRSIASPVSDGKRVFVPYARGDTLTAIELGGQGDVTDSHVLWKAEKYSADVPTPATHNEHIYVTADKSSAYCLDAESGKLVWQGKLEQNRNTYSSSPVVAGGHVYMTREDGTTFVLKEGDVFEVVAENSLDEQTVATPVFVDGRIYLRTYEHLYCFADD